MNKRETVQIMAVLKAAYPNYYRGLSAEDLTITVNLWAEMFESDPYNLVGAAVKSLIADKQDDFPPTIGAVRNKITLLTQNEGMTEAEAWAIVDKAVGRSLYNSESEWEKLPPAIKRSVGSASQLKQWAMLPEDELETVVASNFRRSYRATVQRETDLKALPSDVRQYITGLADTLMLEGAT